MQVLARQGAHLPAAPARIGGLALVGLAEQQVAAWPLVPAAGDGDVLEYYLEHIPVPGGWDQGPCGYLLFSQAYEGQAADARGRGWQMRALPGEHLHQVVDPSGVTQGLIELARAVSAAPG